MVGALDRYLSSDPDTLYGRDDTTRAHLVEHARVYPGAAADQRVFLVRGEDGDVAAWAKLWVREGVAQVEDVVCLHPHRGRGFGRDVVSAATRAALEDGADLVFIVADDADWPKHLYGRMGYATIGHVGLGLRHAPPTGRTREPRRYSAGRGSSRRPPA
jgi:GNAT superfamily N-acetyltransferase